MDARSNIYSVGILLYDLLGGAAARRSDADPLPPLELLHPGLSEETYQLVDKSTQEEEWLRYASYDELEEALNMALLAEGSDPIATPAPVSALPPTAGVASTAGGLPLFLRDYWQPLLVLLALLVFVGAILFTESQDPPEATNGTGEPGVIPVGGEASPTPTPEETGTRPTREETPAGGAAGVEATVPATPTMLLSPTISATPTLPPTATLLPPLPTETATATATNTQPPPPPPSATPTNTQPPPTEPPPPTATNTQPPPPPPPPATNTSEPPATATEAPPATATPPVPTPIPETPTTAPPTPTAPPPGARQMTMT